MSTMNNRWLIDLTRWMAIFAVLWTMGTPSVTWAQQPNSHVLSFAGTIPSQPDGPVALRLRLFNLSDGGSPLFEETQTVMVANQTFTVRIGDATAGGVAATLFRDNASLWIAFAFDNSPDVEIGFRTAITSGGYAHAAQLLTTPTVRTLNGLTSDVSLAAGTNVTITPSGNTLTIDAAGGGLASVNHDATLAGTGTSSTPLMVAAPLQLSSNSGSSTIFGMNGNGFGTGVSGQSPAGWGVRGGTSSGQGVAGDANTTGIGVSGTSDSGTGVLASSNTGPGIIGQTASTNSSAAGVIGQILAPSPGGFSAGVRGINDGTGATGIGVWGSQNGSGWGVYGTSISGLGVYGQSTSGSGVLGQVTSGSGVSGSAGGGDGVLGISGSGVGVHGVSSAGSAGVFEGKVSVTGNLGVGTTNPAAKLDVSGDARVTGKLTINGGIPNDGGGLKHMRGTGTVIPGGVYTDLYFTWPTPFPDDNYTVSVTLRVDTGNARLIQVADVVVHAEGVEVWVFSNDPGYQDVLVHIIAVHD